LFRTTFDEIHSSDSPLHRLDPRARLVCALALIATSFVIADIGAILLFLALTTALYPLGRLPLRVFWRHLKAFSWLYAITFLIHLIFHPGHKLIDLPIVGQFLSLEGLQAGMLFTVRIAALISISTLLLTLTPPQDMTDGLERMFRPFSRLGLPVSDGALTISIALRFVPVLLEEGVKIRRAQMARGADLEGLWLKRMRSIPPLVIPLFASALKRADDLAAALEVRAYRGGSGRTRMTQMRFSLRDIMALAVVFGVAAIFWIQR
jgi:energy-coupling factor transport system permease protein